MWQRGGGGGTRSFSENVSNQLGTVANHFHASLQEKKPGHAWPSGDRVDWGASCNREGKGASRGQGTALETFFFSLIGAFQLKPLAERQWCLVTLLNRLSLASSSGLRSTATITRTQSLLCRLAHRCCTYTT